MVQLQPGRLLAISPHTDDVELGAGGLLARFLEEGWDIWVAALSIAEASLPEGSSPTRLRDEYFAAMTVLGISDDQRLVYDYPVRHFPEHRQAILEDLVALRAAIEPDLVLLPSSNDVHQDHGVVAQEGTRAFLKNATIWGYELPWNHVSFSADAYVALEPSHLDTKWQVLSAYETQVELGRPYFTRDQMESLARVRGNQVGTELAEAFEVVRLGLT